MRCRKCGAAINQVAVRTAGRIVCPPCRLKINSGLDALELELTAKVEALKQRFNRRQM